MKKGILNRGKSGITMIEVILVAGTFGLLLQGVLIMSDQYTKGLERELALSERDEIISALTNGIRSDLSSYQINFDSDVDAKQMLQNKVDELPLAWTSDGRRSDAIKDCPHCPGRLGFVIQPEKSLPGIYRVSVLVLHEKFFPKPGYYFEFFASTK